MHDPGQGPGPTIAGPPRPAAPAPLRLLGAKSGMRGTFRPLRSGCCPRPLPPLRSGAGLGPPSLRAAPGARRSGSPPARWLRLSGRAAPADRGPPAPRRPRCAVGCGLRRLGPGSLGCVLWSPWGCSGPGSVRPCAAAAGSLRPPPRLPAAGAPLPGPGFARLRCACPLGSGPGAYSGPLGRFLRPPAPGPVGVGVAPLRRRCAAPVSPAAERRAIRGSQNTTPQNFLLTATV